MSIITFNQLNKMTKDGRYTQRDLIAKVIKCATGQGYDSGVAQSAVNSFVNNGITETYDELGYQEWMKMINQVVAHEGRERSK